MLTHGQRLLNDECEDDDVEGDARGGGENRQGREESPRLGAPIFVKHLRELARKEQLGWMPFKKTADCAKYNLSCGSHFASASIYVFPR